MRRARIRSVLFALAACASAGLGGAWPGTVMAHDAPMPGDARHGRLIDEPWTMRHWAPFSERLAERELGLAHGQLEAFLYDDHHTLAQLARARGIPFETLVARLSAWTDDAPGADRAEIEQRIRLVLVSGHLAQHVLFHVFHGAGLTPVVFDAAAVPTEMAEHHRAAGWSFRRLVKAGGADPAAVERDLRRRLGQGERDGVAAGETPAAQAATVVARQERALHCWMTRPMQRLDPSAPYGRRYLKQAPGHTAADVPTTIAAQAREEAAIEGGRRGLRPGCWQVPSAFRGPAGMPLGRQELRGLARVPAGFQGPLNGPGGDGVHGDHDM